MKAPTAVAEATVAGSAAGVEQGWVLRRGRTCVEPIQWVLAVTGGAQITHFAADGI